MKELIAKNNYYEISVDTEKNRIYRSLYGFWKDPSVVPGYFPDVKIAVEQLSSGFTSILDVRRAKTPPPEIVDIHMNVLLFLNDNGLTRTAQIIEHLTEKIVLKRALMETDSTETAMQFNTINEAEEWLDSFD